MRRWCYPSPSRSRVHRAGSHSSMFYRASAQVSAQRVKTHLTAPAAVLGPNHSPTSFPSCFPTSAIRCTLNGHAADGSSKNHPKICTYVAYFSGSVRPSAGILQSASGQRRGSTMIGERTHLFPNDDAPTHLPTSSAPCATYIPTLHPSSTRRVHRSSSTATAMS